MENKKVQYMYLSILNIVAGICVIFMHCNGIVHSYQNSRAWTEAMFVETIAYWAVPVFFMNSGATLLEYRKRYSTKIFIKKRLLKTGIPFLAWSLINLIWKVACGRIQWKWSLLYLIDLIINCKIENVYWFFIPLFSIYLSIPIISILVEEQYQNVLCYMMFLGVMTVSVFPLLCNLLGIQYNSSISFPLTGGYIIYILLGYWLSKMELKKVHRIMIYIFGIFCAILRFSSTVYMSRQTGELYKMFWGYTNLPCVGLAVAVFVFAKYFKWEKIINSEKKKKIVNELSASSFGIYLVHMIIINGFYILGVNVWGRAWRVFGALFVYSIGLIIIQIMKKIPFVNKIVP